jgi:hypothetical protein
VEVQDYLFSLFREISYDTVYVVIEGIELEFHRVQIKENNQNEYHKWPGLDD